MKHQPPALLLGLFYASVDIANSLGRRGIRLFGVDRFHKPVGARSRFIERLDAPSDGAELMSFLESFARGTGTRPILFALADPYVIFVSEHAARCAESFSFPMTRTDTLRRLMSKSEAASLFAELDIRHPRTAIVPRGANPPPIPADFSEPCILKPLYKHQWENEPALRGIVREGQVVAFAADKAEMANLLATLSPVSDLIVQEFVPGPSTNHYYYAGYRDRNGNIVASMLGKKIRTLPDCLGSETLLESVHHGELLAYGDEILHRLDYRGAAGIDFKLDPRDDRFKVIEMNCRIGINDCHLMRRGVDIPYMYYLDSRRIEVVPVRNYAARVTWYDPLRDFDWMRLYGRERGFGWLSWFLQLFRHDTYALLYWRDPWPFAATALQRIWRLLRRFGRAAAAAR